jgi:thiazole synthase
MELGADAVLVNTAIAVAGNSKLMAEAFRKPLLLVEKHMKPD